MLKQPILLLMAFAFLATAALAQNAGLSVPAWIESEGVNLNPSFAVTMNGKPAGIHSQLGPSSDQMILLVLDVTGDPAFVDPAREALATQIAKLPRNSWVALLRAQDGLHVLADPSPDHRAVLDGITNLPNSGHPGLLETVEPALELADGLIRRTPVRVSVLYVTDSNVYSYREDFTNPVINQSDPHDLSRRFPEALIEEKISKLIDATAALEAPLFVIHVRDRGDRLNRAYENGLQTLAEATGGRTDICRSVGEIPEAIAAAFGRISNGWQIYLTVPPRVHGMAHIHVTGRSGDEELKLSWRNHLEMKERHKDAGATHPNRPGSDF